MYIVIWYKVNDFSASISNKSHLSNITVKYAISLYSTYRIRMKLSDYVVGYTMKELKREVELVFLRCVIQPENLLLTIKELLSKHLTKTRHTARRSFCTIKCCRCCELSRWNMTSLILTGQFLPFLIFTVRQFYLGHNKRMTSTLPHFDSILMPLSWWLCVWPLRRDRSFFVITIWFLSLYLCLFRCRFLTYLFKLWYF